MKDTATRTEQEKIEVSTIKTMLRILRYDEMQTKALCMSVAKLVIKDREMSDEAAEEIFQFVADMTKVSPLVVPRFD